MRERPADMSNTPRLRGSSPWGQIDHLTRFERNGELVAVSVSTPSHGGFWVAAEHMAAIPAALRSTPYSAGQWFEEDCDWCIPYAFLRLHEIDTGTHSPEACAIAAREALERWHKVTAP